MSTHDYSIANDTFPNVRTDLNNVLAAILGQNNSGSAPSTTAAYMRYANTGGVVYRRNAANSGWVLDGTLAETFVTAKSAGYTVALTDFQRLITCTGTFTLSLTAVATLVDGFWFMVRNAGSGVITIDPNSTEQVDGATTVEIYPGESCLVMSNGTAWYTVGRHAPTYQVGSFTRDMSLASGSQAVTGVGFKPRAVLFLAGQASPGGAGMSIGFDNGSTKAVAFDQDQISDDTYQLSTGSSIFEILTASNYYQGNISSLDADGFTISWTKTGSPTGTLTIPYLAMR